MELPKRIPPARFDYLVDPMGMDMRPEVRPSHPPVVQTSLFLSTEDQAYELIEPLQRKYMTDRARVRHLAKKLGISQDDAKRAYKKALGRFIHQLKWDYCQANAEYLTWRDSPEAKAYMRRYVEEIDSRVKAANIEFDRRVEQGAEHVVVIDAHDPELLKVLDIPFFADCTCQSPISYLCRQPGLTENDARILWVKGFMTLAIGQEETLFNHQFMTREELERRRQENNERRAKCIECGQELSYNDIGFAAKLGQRGLCPNCIGAEPEYVDSVVRTYRSSGCQMFI